MSLRSPLVFGLLAGAAALVSGAATTAHAADFKTGRDFGDVPPVIPFIEAADPMADFTGAYVGATLGYALETDHGIVTTGTPGFLGLAPAITPEELENEGGGGFVAGLHAGVNLAVSQGFVIGGELDVSFGDLTTEGDFTGAPVLGTAGLRTSAEADVKWMSTAKVRAGGMAFDDLMIYGTGGLAIGGVDVTTEVAAIDNPALMWTGETQETKVGFAVGAGAEYAVGPNASIRAEYLYYDLGSVEATAAGNAAVRAVPALDGVDYISETELKGHLLKAGLNIRLNSLF